MCTYYYKHKESEIPGEKGEESLVLVSGGADAQVHRWEPSSRMNPFLYAVNETYPGHKGAVRAAS